VKALGTLKMIRDFIDPHWSTFAITAFVQFILFVRWIYRRVRNDEIMRMFVEEMATSHLPHIYELLAKICEEKGIEREDDPPIRWMDFEKIGKVKLES
jgi:hypothetical protein